MDEAELKVGDVVRVRDAGFRPAWGFRPPPGEIMQFDGEARRCLVRLGIDFARKEVEDLKDRQGWFAVANLQKLETWTLLERSVYLFGERGFHICCFLKVPWTPENLYMHSAHKGSEPPKAVRRILVNTWGTVHEFDACEGHVQLDGRCMDIIP